VGDKPCGWATLESGERIALSSEECEALWAAAEADQVRRAAEMPDEKAAIQRMFDGWLRLKELGWREASYCPKDGSPFDVIEPGSTGIHRAHYWGEWPTGGWMVEAAGDLYPSSPILFRLDPEAEAERKRKLAEAIARYRHAR
jgi:hypothetical protein